MSLHVHRSPRVEELVDALHEHLVSTWPQDPFAAIPILIGSRGMGRWLRQELATRAGSCARLDFLFPRNAFEAAAVWLLGDPEAASDHETVFWSLRGAVEPWSGSALVARVLVVLRAEGGGAAFAAVRRYLDASGVSSVNEPVGSREAAFAMQVAGVIERLHYDRPKHALAWSRAPESAPNEHRWLAVLLSALEAENGQIAGVGERAFATKINASPAARLEALQRLPAQARNRSVQVFGLSTLRPGDKLWLAELSRHLAVHVYTLVPSRGWWGHVRTHRERVKSLHEKLTNESLSSLDRAEVNELFSQNDLLAANGGPSRDLQLWFEEFEYIDEDAGGESSPASGPRSMLHELQAWLDAADVNPTHETFPWRAQRSCPSVAIHACHGALRQCEALRDELLRVFAKDPTLEPRHVLVMTPDVATYAPLVAAVFGRQSAAARRSDGERVTAPELPAIPVNVADLGLRATNAVAEVLLRVLALTDERVTASALLECLSLWPVRKRFGLTEAELPDVRELVLRSGLRWAWDKADRKRHEQPELQQNTVQFALERMALGVLMPDEEPLGCLPETEHFEPTVPLDVASLERVERFGKFAAFAAALVEQRDLLCAPGAAGDWRLRLTRALEMLTLVDDADTWLLAEVTDALGERLPDALGSTVTLAKDAVETLLAEAFELPVRGDRPLGGAVTVCAMEPMRSVPFRIIAMLGLDDGAFPRIGKTPAWDPFATPLFGEHDRRALDRHLFLESVLCARDALWLFGTGFEAKRGTETSLAIVASELQELLVKGCGLTASEAKASAWPRRPHPLQPWSATAFADSTDRERDRLPYDAVWYEGRAALARATMAKPEHVGSHSSDSNAVWPLEQNAPLQLSVEALAKALENAPRELLKSRLGLTLDRREDELPSREPIELAELDSWSVRDRLLKELERAHTATAELTAPATDPRPHDAQALLDEPATFVERALLRLRAEGTLPLHSGGRSELENAVKEVQTVEESAQKLGGEPRPSFHATVQLGALTLLAHAPHVRALTTTADASGEPELLLFWKTPSHTANESLQLTAWLTLLVVCAAGHPVRTAHVVGVTTENNRTFTFAEGPAAATEELQQLVSVWRESRERPVPLFPKLSRKLAELSIKLAKNTLTDVTETDEELVEECFDEWNGTFEFPGGLKENPWIATAYPEWTLQDFDPSELVRVAKLVWGRALGPPAAAPSPSDAHAAAPSLPQDDDANRPMGAA